jgi:lipopolysaccharide transport protein LptA
MKLSNHVLLFACALLLTWTVASRAQQANDATDTSGADTPPPGSTVITSDELHSDQLSHTSVFDGNVMVVGTSFNLTCDEMKVLFGKDGKVDHIIAIGNVVINQPGRVTHSGQVDYYREDDKFVLTDQPVIVDNKNQISAPKITIYRTNQTMVTEGKPTKVILVNGGIGSGTSTPPAPLPDK